MGKRKETAGLSFVGINNNMKSKYSPIYNNYNPCGKMHNSGKMKSDKLCDSVKDYTVSYENNKAASW